MTRRKPLSHAQAITLDDLSGYWSHLKRAAAEVAKWPDWKLGTENPRCVPVPRKGRCRKGTR